MSEKRCLKAVWHATLRGSPVHTSVTKMTKKSYSVHSFFGLPLKGRILQIFFLYLLVLISVPGLWEVLHIDFTWVFITVLLQSKEMHASPALQSLVLIQTWLPYTINLHLVLTMWGGSWGKSVHNLGIRCTKELLEIIYPNWICTEITHCAPFLKSYKPAPNVVSVIIQKAITF